MPGNKKFVTRVSEFYVPVKPKSRKDWFLYALSYYLKEDAYLQAQYTPEVGRTRGVST